MTSKKIRQSFVRFFEERKHTFVPSSPVAPLDDPTLLFTNAGMNQFKDVFLGTATRDYRRAVNSQKCIRAGGKHNDLDDVGHDTYHHTFFEMLGSWSFGDYFKEDAIRWAWEFLTEVCEIPGERLHATYFGGDEADGVDPDDEARQLWLDVTGISEDRVHPFGKKDNFWEMADVGPCGPCTEIHVDLTPDLSGGPLVNADDARVFEVWNLVFIQFNRSQEGLSLLPAKHVDTGMGFERLVTVLQGKKSNYDTDVFTPLLEAIRDVTGAAPYGGRVPVPGQKHSDDEMRDISYRVVADHLRCLSFAIADGALPDNKDRGSVLRRILRRGYRYGYQYLGMREPFLHRLVPTLAEQMSGAFPEIGEQASRVAEVIHEEEESFARTLETGLKLFHGAAEQAEAQDGAGATIPGDVAFKLHDTYGFPVDLTKILADERGLGLDEAAYEERMEEAKERARRAGKSAEHDLAAALVGEAAAKNPVDVFETLATDDTPKFSAFELETEVVGWFAPNGALHQDDPPPAETEAGLVLEQTCFYAEQGGQVGDSGRITTEDGAVFEVLDTQRIQDAVLHIGRVLRGEIRPGAVVRAEVDPERRRAIMSNHTATHLLNHGLRDVLGEHVMQKGSLVDEEKTRFDFSHSGPVTGDELARIEEHVGRQIGEALPVQDDIVALDAAKGVNSLRAVFGEKYPDEVRVVSIGPKVDELLGEPQRNDWHGFSIELCGGTHVASTDEIAHFVVTSEEGVAKGVRRVVGISGDAARGAQETARQLHLRLDRLEDATPDELATGLAAVEGDLSGAVVPVRERAAVLARTSEMREAVRKHEKAQAAEQGEEVRDRATDLLDTATKVGDAHVIVGEVPQAPPEKLREAIDWLRQKTGSAAVMLFAPADGKVTLLAGLTQDLVDRGLDAKSILREAGKVVGGGGGGRPDLAQGGGKKPEKVGEAVETVREWLVGQLG